ncbi:hypothetical protein ILUMI_21319 [Ignelater luminosus]|uniref:Peptidase S1 domain-containing protein n=1 Tax=Ignelater luminosus TaxID=2038154 RepID=A0A8K0CJ03_IGNLU|nr:hypothetical protein ILUMI_21319 [Ignelater luminosus]
MASIVLIRWRNGRPYEELRGGGTLITSTYEYSTIITAGSTLRYFEANNISPEDVRIRFNSEYWNECHCGVFEDSNVAKWQLHSQYYEDTLPFLTTYSYHDIGLIAIRKEGAGFRWRTRLNLTFPNVPLDSIKPFALGWGWSKDTEEVHKELRKISNLKIISHERCQQIYQGHLPANAFCVESHTRGGAAPCPYDQGGPLLWDYKYQTYLIGIMSTTPRCIDPDYPPIITNSSRYIDFIQNTTWLYNKTIF